MTAQELKAFFNFFRHVQTLWYDKTEEYCFYFACCRFLEVDDESRLKLVKKFS